MDGLFLTNYFALVATPGLPSVFLREPPNHSKFAFVGDVGALLGASLFFERRQRIGGECFHEYHVGVIT